MGIISSKQQAFPSMLPTPEREEALQCLREFLPHAGEYAKYRNFDRPDNQAVSGLSPYIRYRILREREVLEAVLRMHPSSSVGKFVDEVCWRTYWKGYMEMRPEIWEAYCADVERLSAEYIAESSEAWQKAVSGKTGIACFDHWSRQLSSTGWLHNHARMWFASIWVFTLKLPWQLGAAYFLENLLDGDPASNTLSWRWVAGLHTPGKTYIARAANIHKYTEGRFNPEGQLRESPEALPADGPWERSPLPPVTPLSEALFPSLSSCPAGLLVCPEDLSPEIGELSETPFSSLCVLNARDIMDGYHPAPHVQHFLNAAVEDAGRRLSRHWSAKVVQVEGGVSRLSPCASPDHVGCKEILRVYSGCVDKWIDAVVTWAENENLKSVWILQPPIGPWRDAMGGLRVALRMRSIRFFEFRRNWDAVHWPHATAGYFTFKKGLKDRLETILG